MLRQKEQYSLIVQFQQEITAARQLRDKLHEDLKSLAIQEMALYEKSLPTAYTKQFAYKPDPALDNKMAHIDYLIKSFEDDFNAFFKTREVQDYLQKKQKASDLLVDLKSSLIEGIKKTVTSCYIHAMHMPSVFLEKFLDKFSSIVQSGDNNTLYFDLNQKSLEALVRYANIALTSITNPEVHAAFEELMHQSLSLSKTYTLNDFFNLVRKDGTKQVFELKIKAGKEELFNEHLYLDTADKIATKLNALGEQFTAESQSAIDLFVSQLTAKKDHLEILALEALAKEKKPFQKIDIALANSVKNIHNALNQKTALDHLLAQTEVLSQKAINSFTFEQDQEEFLHLKNEIFQQVAKFNTVNEEADRSIHEVEKWVKVFGKITKYTEIQHKYDAHKRSFLAYLKEAPQWVDCNKVESFFQAIQTKLTFVQQQVQREKDKLMTDLEEHEWGLVKKTGCVEDELKTAFDQDFKDIKMACDEVKQIYIRLKYLANEIESTLNIPYDFSLLDLKKHQLSAADLLTEFNESITILGQKYKVARSLLKACNKKLGCVHEDKVGLIRKMNRAAVNLGTMTPRNIDALSYNEKFNDLIQRIATKEAAEQALEKERAQKVLHEVIRKTDYSGRAISKEAAKNLQEAKDTKTRELNDQLFGLLKAIFNDGNVEHFWNRQIHWLQRSINQITDAARVQVRQDKFSVPRGIYNAHSLLCNLQEPLAPEIKAQAIKAACEAMMARLNKNGLVRQKPSELLYDAVKQFLDKNGKLYVTQQKLDEFKKTLGYTTFNQLQLIGFEIKRGTPPPSKKGGERVQV